MNIKKGLKFFALVVLLTIAGGAAYFIISTQEFLHSERIAPAVTIAGVPVGNLSRDEALRQLQQEWLPHLPHVITVIAGDKEFQLETAKLGQRILLEEAVQQAWRIGREGNWLKRLQDRFRLSNHPLEISVPVVVEETRLRAEVAALAQKVDRKPIDATVNVTEDDNIAIQEGQKGLKLDQEAAVKALRAALTRLEKGPLQLPCKTIPPRVTAKDLSHLEVVLGSFSTPYNAKKVDRTHNLRLAVQAINKTVIMPGEIFSTDQTIGPRIAERGFREAPIFQDGEVTPATGGGICQIATTIYNAALLAGLPIVERHHHSQPVPYVAAGRDATVYAGQLDLRFRNDTGAPILLLAAISSSHVQIRIIGALKAKKKVRIETASLGKIPFETKEIPDPSLELGQHHIEKKGRAGIKVAVYRIITQADGTEKRELLHTDVYKPQAEIVRVGTKPTYYKGPDGKPLLGPDGKPIPVQLGPDGKPLPPPKLPPKGQQEPAGKPQAINGPGNNSKANNTSAKTVQETKPRPRAPKTTP